MKELKVLGECKDKDLIEYYKKVLQEDYLERKLASLFIEKIKARVEYIILIQGAIKINSIGFNPEYINRLDLNKVEKFVKESLNFSEIRVIKESETIVNLYFKP